MSTSDIQDREPECNNAFRTALIYLVISVFSGLFGAVYELFSHEVYSYYMIYAFAFPLVLGTLPFMILHSKKIRRYPNIFARNLYHSGIAALTVGSIVRGVLDIYGTSNRLSTCYWWLGGSFIIGAAVVFSCQKVRSTEDSGGAGKTENS